MDRQSVKTTSIGGERGYDSAKQIKGRQRHGRVETQGLLLTVQGHPANVLAREGVPRLLPPELTQARFPRLAPVWLDAGDNGRGQGQDGREKTLGGTTITVRPPSRRVIVFEDVEPAPRPACPVLPRRWVVERTFAWWGHSRRLSTAYERLCASSEAMISAVMSRLMVRRLAAV
jgi:putative transposase